jgi:branched-chain amino acid transport system permease protein
MMALGLTLVYGLLRILHIAHAAVFTLGAYVGCWSLTTGSLWRAFPLAMIAAGIVGPLIYRLVYEPVLNQNRLTSP